MVTSRRERKCIDSSSAGRAGIFYCSSWRTVCWLPVPPPAGREDTQQDKGDHGHVSSSSSSSDCKPLTAQNDGLSPRPTPTTALDEDVPPWCHGGSAPPTPDGSSLSYSIQHGVGISYGTSAAVKDLRRFGGNITASINNRQPTSCHMPPQTCNTPDCWWGKVANTCAEARSHKHSQGARMRSDNNSLVSMAALCSADKTTL